MNDFVGVDQDLAGFKAIANENFSHEHKQANTEDDDAEKRNTKRLETMKTVVHRLDDQSERDPQRFAQSGNVEVLPQDALDLKEYEQQNQAVQTDVSNKILIVQLHKVDCVLADARTGAFLNRMSDYVALAHDRVRESGDFGQKISIRVVRLGNQHKIAFL